MNIEFEGRTIKTTEEGFLVNVEDWSESLARELARLQDIELKQLHWDVIRFLRDEYFNNNGHQPNNRVMMKELGAIWGRKVSSKEMYELFPGNPSKQAGLIAGLPESKRKGGY